MAVTDLPRWSVAGGADDWEVGCTITPPADLDGDGVPGLVVGSPSSDWARESTAGVVDVGSGGDRGS